MPAPEVPAAHLEICFRRARRYARKYRLDPDHVLSDVLYHYAKQAVGKPDRYVETIAAGACVNSFRAQVGRNPDRPKPRPASLSGACGRLQAASAPRPDFDIDAWGLSDDARLVAGLVLDAPAELCGAAFRGALSGIRRFLSAELKKARGWAAERVDAAFGEISEALAASRT